MCGFVSIVNTSLGKQNLFDIIGQLKKIHYHRGPDEIKELHKSKFSILFRRLAIIDLSKNASQPFLSDDGLISLVFNGEIYNYIELKQELKKKKIHFKTKSDTEVLLKSYQVWGVDFIKKIRGMFSILIFDEKKNKFLCFRDHLGQKPLYYSKFSHGIIFSSEIKDILFIRKNNSLSKNRNTILKYLVRGWCDDTNETFFDDILSFPAGCIGEVKNSSIKIKKYWKLDISKQKQFDKEEFKEIFLNNIKLHLRSDVPIAFTLSAGLDSSSIVKSSIDSSLKDYKAFSLLSNFDEENDEKNFIKEFIKQNSLKHSFFNVHDHTEENVLEKIIFFQDEPIGHTSFLNQFLLRQKIHNEGYKVLLVGEGGDEVLGVYNRMFLPYIYSIFLKNKKKIPNEVKKNISLNLGENFSKIEKSIKLYSNFLKNKNDIEDKEVFNFLNTSEEDIPKILAFYNPTNPNQNNAFKNFLLNHIFKRDLPHILRQEDRISMSQSIENRTPFVDHKFIEYVFSIHENYFMKNGQSKFMLRNLMQNKLPKAYFSKKKIGRPGNPKVLIFEFYFTKFCDYLQSSDSKNEFFDNNKVLQNLIHDKEKCDYRVNNNIYFRILNYLIWKKNLKESGYF